eukprot:jgi/Ulvmu1/12192/UM085_0056.1
MKYSIFPHVFACAHDCGTQSPMVHRVLGGMEERAEGSESAIRAANDACQGTRRTPIESEKHEQSNRHIHRLLDRKRTVAKTTAQTAPGLQRTPANTASRKELTQHWRPPGLFVQRAQQYAGGPGTQLMSTPVKRTSPMYVKRKTNTSAYACHPVHLDFADSPATPEDHDAAKLRHDFRVTPPSMRSPELNLQQNIKMSAYQRDAAGVPCMESLGCEEKSLRPCPASPHPSKHNAAVVEPVRVPTAPGAKSKIKASSRLGTAKDSQGYAATVRQARPAPEATGHDVENSPKGAIPRVPMAYPQSESHTSDGLRRASCGHFGPAPNQLQTQTPRLKRSRSVITCDGDMHAFCASTGETVLQPSKGSSPAGHRAASADPFVIPTIAHMLACAEEQRGSQPGATRTASGSIPAAQPRLPISASADWPCSNTALAKVHAPAPVPAVSSCAYAHSGRSAVHCTDAGGAATIDAHPGASAPVASASATTGLPESGEAPASCCAPAVVLQPFPDVPGVPASVSVDAGSWFGTHGGATSSSGVQVPSDGAGFSVAHGAKLVPVQESGVQSDITSKAVPKAVQTTPTAMHMQTCDVAVQAEGIQLVQSHHSMEAHGARQATRDGAPRCQRLSDAACLAADDSHTAGADFTQNTTIMLQRAREDWRRQISVIQQFACERIVPLLARCARGPPEESMGPLTGQALSMLSQEAANEWREVVRPLQEAAAVLEGAALNTRQLNADLSATQVELRASEFELGALRAEHAAVQRTLQAQLREARCQQEGEACIQARCARLEDEAAREKSAKEVLALALGRVLRETRYAIPRQSQGAPPGEGAADVDELQAHLQRMSVHESPAAEARVAIVQHSIAAAHQILDMPASELSARFASVSPEQACPARTSRGWFDSACLDSRVLRFAPSDGSSLARTPPARATHSAAAQLPLSQPPDTSCLFPGVASRSPSAGQAAPDATPPATADSHGGPLPPSPGMFPEASLNFGVACTPARTASPEAALAPEADQARAGHEEHPECVAADSHIEEEAKLTPCITDHSPSPSNPMRTPSSAGTSCHGREPNENLPPAQGCPSGAVCAQQHSHACPDTSPLARWKLGRPLDTAAVEHASGVDLQAPDSSRTWLENVIQPARSFFSLNVEPTLVPAVCPGQRLARADADAASGSAASIMQSPARGHVQRKDTGVQSAPLSCASAGGDGDAVAGAVSEAGAPPQAGEAPEWLADDGPRPTFSSNSPDHVDRYKDFEAEPQVPLVVPDMQPHAGGASSGVPGGVAAVERQLSMSGLRVSGGAPFSVLPREQAVGLHCEAWQGRPMTDRTDAQPAAAATPVENTSPQWLAALEGQAAPKSLSVPSAIAAAPSQPEAITPVLTQHLGTDAKLQGIQSGTDLARDRPSDLADDCSPLARFQGRMSDCHDAVPDAAAPEVGAIEGSDRGDADCAPHRSTSYRCDAWLTEQLANAQQNSRKASDGEDAFARRGAMQALAAALPDLPTCCSSGSRAQGATGDFEGGSDRNQGGERLSKEPVQPEFRFGMHDIQRTHDERGLDDSPVIGGVPEPFAWRGKLPGATARAAALEIRHFCAASQHSSDRLPQRDEDVKGRPGAGQRCKAPQRRKKVQSRLIVPHSPELATARRVHGEIRLKEPLTASKEHARRATDVGRKRATVLAGHFRGSYAQRAAAAGRLRKAGAEVGYATLAKQKNRINRQEDVLGYY